MTQLLVGARVWDGVSDGYAPPDWVVCVEDGRIAYVGPARAAPATVEEIRLDGLALLPGLIDAHVHLSLDPERRGAEAEDPERAPRRAASMLEGGITTARDLGSGGYDVLTLRDAIDAGTAWGPRLLVAGPPLTTPGGHCHFWGGEVADLAESERAIEALAGRGVDWIKVMATGGVLTPGTRPSAAQFGSGELREIVAMTRDRGLPVAAHCHGTAGISACAEAGVTSIEHASFAGPDGFGSDFRPAVCEAIAGAGCWVAPTVNAGWRRFLGSSTANPRFAERMRRCYRALREAGVSLVASTDAGIPGTRHRDLPRALPVWAELAELSPVEALRSATSESARALGLDAETGRVAKGLSADLIAVAGDPLAALDDLADVRWVMARGRAAAGES